MEIHVSVKDLELRQIRLELTKSLRGLSDTEKLLDELGRDLLRETGVRIFEKGIKSEGGDIISSYSTKPMYVPARASSKLNPKGKDGKGTFKSGKKKKSTYLPRGYSELKQKLGRTLPLELTGQFKAAYQSARGKKAVVLGFQDVERKTFASGVKESSDLSNDELRKGLEERFGVFTALSEREEKLIDLIVEDFINRNL